ncbi:glycosyltransferase family 2 protein [Sporosarcina sp. CAU 1771]
MTMDLIEKPFISIIMPAYNCENFVEESILSVINQTYIFWELIVIDDGSIDNTNQIIQNLASSNERIRIFKNESNRGVSETRNKGISLAKGEWIAFLDSDDMWKEKKLEKQIYHALKKDVSFVFTGSSYVDVIGKPYKGVFEVPEVVTYKKLRKHNVISCSSVLAKKTLFNSIKMERDDLHEDYAVWLRILKLGDNALGINEPLLIYRISKKSKSGNKIKTIKMTYKVYRFIGINPIASIYFMTNHIIKSVFKYKRIMY